MSVKNRLSAFSLFVSIFIAHLLSAQCLPVPPAPSCDGSEPLAVAGETINSGTRKWIYGAPATFGNLRVRGGTLTVCGNLTLNDFSIDSGSVYIAPGATLTIHGGAGLQMFGNTAIYNYGTLQLTRNLSMERNYASPAQPNILINATADAVLKMDNQYFVINGPSSHFVNNGTASFWGLINDAQSTAGSVCLGDGSEMRMAMVINKVNDTYTVPAGNACVQVFQYSQFTDSLTASPGLNMCLPASHRSETSCYACKPNAWGAANIFNNCNSCEEIALLRLRIIDFRVTNNNGQSKLEWALDNHNEAATFSIERSANGKNFEVVGAVRAQAIKRYSFIDEPASDPTLYYRIVARGQSGLKSTSEVLKLTKLQPDKIRIYPNPFLSNINISFPKSEERIYSISLSDITGRVLYKWKNPGPHSVITLKIPANLQKGKYMLQISTHSGIIAYPVMKFQQ